MQIRHATVSDLNEILKIYEYARGFMAINGNPNQWGYSHPPKDSLIQNIEQEKLYVITENDTVEAVFFFDFGPDPTYDYIDGRWLNSQPYAVIHRIASAGRIKGAVKTALDFALDKCDNIRIDTHADNAIMRHTLEKLGFIYCGTIFVPDYGGMRAYHKVKDSD